MVIQTLVVDDESLAREELCFLLESIPDIRLVGQAANGLEAVDLTRQLKPDLVFLDIQMPGRDGFQVVQDLLVTNDLPRIVFVTAFDQYAIRAFEVNAVDYLLKPVDKARLGEAVARCRRQIGEGRPLMDQIERILGTLERSAQRSRQVIKVGERFMLVDSRDIIYATVEDGVIRITTDLFTGSSNLRTLDELLERLDSLQFWRVHRSYIVNMQRIKEVIPWFNRTLQLKMADRKESEIPVSRSQTRRLREFLKL
jgi:two-component system LytT family response regulator/two-component system response regulator LytT